MFLVTPLYRAITWGLQISSVEHRVYVTALRKHAYSKTVDSRYLDLAYLEEPLILKWNSGPWFNMEI